MILPCSDYPEDRLTTILKEQGLELIYKTYSERPEGSAGNEVAWAVPEYTKDKQFSAFGIKLHISANAYNSAMVATEVIPRLLRRQCAFKCLATTSMVLRQNNGLYGHTQIGKFITVYPEMTHSELLSLARELAEATKDVHAPDVPTDYRLFDYGSVYYRYGEILAATSTHVSPEDYDYQDTRDIRVPVPPQVDDPLAAWRSSEEAEALLPKQYVVTGTLRQRASGTVLRATELRLDEHGRVCGTRRVVLKQGRWSGEALSPTCDAQARLLWQESVLDRLGKEPEFPEVLGSFMVGRDRFLSMADLGGESLWATLRSASEPVDPEWVRRITQSIAGALAKVHNQGLLAGDLSPDNILILEDEKIGVADLADTIGPNSPNTGAIGTVGYIPQRAHLRITRARDLFGLSALVHDMISAPIAELPRQESTPQSSKYRIQLPPSTPPDLKELGELCLDEDNFENLRFVEERLQALVRLPENVHEMA